MFLFLRAFVIAGGVAGAYLIANEKKWGYYLGIAVAGVALLGRLYVGIRYHISPLDYDIIGFAFDVALVALLLHTQTREYTRIWFK
jgi:bacteriorhodopsin